GEHHVHAAVRARARALGTCDERQATADLHAGDRRRDCECHDGQQAAQALRIRSAGGAAAQQQPHLQCRSHRCTPWVYGAGCIVGVLDGAACGCGAGAAAVAGGVVGGAAVGATVVGTAAVGAVVVAAAGAAAADCAAGGTAAPMDGCAVSATICPSRICTVREHQAATCGSWVTTTRAAPVSRAAVVSTCSTS